MTYEPDETSSSSRVLGDSGVPIRSAMLAMKWTAVVWSGIVLSVTLSWLLLDLLSPRLPTAPASSTVEMIEALLIAVASLLITYGSLLPGLLGGGRSATMPQIGHLVTGLLIRMTGTVALFLTCRYHMATPIEAIAAMTIGWYVTLTLVNVMVLARELGKPSRPLASAALTSKRGPSFG